jgi:hypothetical protein
VKHTGSSRGAHHGNIFASTSSYTLAPRAVTWTGTTVEKFSRYVSFRLLFTAAVTNSPSKWHDVVLIPRFNLQAPNSGGKDVADSGDLLALQTFNIAYDTGNFPRERHRIQLSGCYLTLAYTGARPAEVVDNERKNCKDGCLEELFGPKAIGGSSGDEEDVTVDDNSKLLEELLSQETVGRGRPKALCYEDIMLMVVRHPETGEDIHTMSIKFHTPQGGRQQTKAVNAPRLSLVS